jgi:hypothetical protein
MRNFFTFLFMCFCFLVHSQDFTTNFIDEETDAMTTGDFNADGYIDIFGVEYRSGKADIYLLLNKKLGSGSSFDRKLISLGTDMVGEPFSIDIDNDGDVDVLYARGANRDMEVFINDGLGGFTSKPLGCSGSTRFEVSDMDKDGDLDIIGINYTEKTVSVYINGGNMQFTRKVVYKDNKNLKEFNTGDLNNDGLSEIAIAIETFTGEQVVVLENKGNNVFQKRIIFIDTYYGVTNVTINDLNKDGLNDLIINDYRSMLLGVNNGNFQFTDKDLHAIYSRLYHRRCDRRKY